MTLALAGLATAIVIAILGWYDARPSNEWEDLLSPEARGAWDFLRRKFEAEERAAAFGCSVAAATGARFLVGLAADRLQLLRRLELYARIVAAAAPPPQRLRVSFDVLSRGFAAMAGLDPERATPSSQVLQELDAETLENCRVLVLEVGRLREG